MARRIRVKFVVMPDSDVIVQLPGEAVARISAAIAGLVPTDPNRFQAVLELGYLAASADGLDISERDALATTLERVTGLGYDHDTFAAHFADLDDAVAALGRRERLARTAAEFETDATRADAIRFAALVAMCDGTLNAPELEVLTEAGAHFHWSADTIRDLVTDVAARMRGER
jgi:tellurite resistance protein